MTEKLGVNEKEPAFGQKTPTTTTFQSCSLSFGNHCGSLLLFVVMRAKTFVLYALKTQIHSHHSSSSMTWRLPKSSKFSTVRPTIFLPCTRTSATFCGIRPRSQIPKPFPVSQALRRRMSTPDRHTSGLNTRSPVQGMGVAQRRCGGFSRSCQSVPNLTAQVRSSIFLSSVMMTSGCRQWNGPKPVVIIR